MKLYYTSTSPFVRKVMVVAHERGLVDKIETTFLRPSPLVCDVLLSKDNPVSKIPTLVLDDGSTLYDSSVICEYLDGLGDAPPLIPASGPPRFRALKLQALADGILEAGVAVFYELTIRPKERIWDDWVAGQGQKAKQALDVLDAEAASFGPTIDFAQVCAACAIGWLEFRGHLGDLRQGRPSLFSWYDTFRKRPSLVSTEPKL